MASTVPRIEELTAAQNWRMVDFISDLHLHTSEPATLSAWQHYMQNTPADAVFILGDLFEVWIGDDVLDQALGAKHLATFETHCVQVLHNTADRLRVFFMHGNRDFLVGQGLMGRCNTTLLADPTVFVFNQRRWLLSHGDALCLDDTAYMTFRHEVRSLQWQKAFLANPLEERQKIAQALRAQSSALKAAGASSYADLDPPATRTWLQAAQAPTLIHGHTHRPTEHDLGNGLSRVVLSDWDLQASPPRAEVLRLSSQGLQRICLV